MIGKYCDNKTVIMHVLRWLLIAYRFKTMVFPTFVSYILGFSEDFQIFATPLKRKVEKHDPIRHFLPFTHSTV